MASLTNALHQLRAEQQVAQLHVEKLDQAISLIESLNGSGVSRQSGQPTRIVSAGVASPSTSDSSRLTVFSDPTSASTR
jgi:hypothetical protein